MNYAYLRLSTNEDKQRNSFMVQMDSIQKSAKIDAIFKERVSGAAQIEKRTELLAMLGRLKKGDIVYVYKLDRIARDISKSGWIRLEIQRRGAQLISINDKTSRDPTGKLIDNILLTVAEHEKDLIRARVRNTMRWKKEQGHKLGGYVPYGSDCIEVDGVKKLVENKQERKNIELILKMNSRGWTLSRICAYCREKNITSKTGKEFSRAAIKKLIERCKQ